MPAPRISALAVGAAALLAAPCVRAADAIGQATFGAGPETSVSNVGRGEGVNALVGWTGDIAIGAGPGSHRAMLDARIGGGDHVFAQRLGAALLPGVRARFGDATSGFLRLGVDARYDKVSSFSVRHLGLPQAELGVRWTSDAPRRAVRDDVDPTRPLPLAEPASEALGWVGSLGYATMQLLSVLNPTRGPGVVSFDVAMHGGLTLLGDWTFATLEDGTRRELPGAVTTFDAAAAMGANATLAVSTVQLRASYTHFAARASVDEARGALCGAVFIFGACADVLVVRAPASVGSADHALGVAGTLSLALVLDSHGAL